MASGQEAATHGSGHSTAGHRTQAQERRARLRARGAKIIRVASAQAGDPYRAGADGPNAFDCSGLTSYVYRVALHKKIPRTSADQSRSVKKISARWVQPGDLVFFHNSSRVYHVAIYAGNNKIWHAPYSGTTVRKEKIWTTSVTYGRVR